MGQDSKMTNYADDTSFSCKGKSEEEVIRILEEDAEVNIPL